jgi:hypothetical protein
MTGCYGQRPLDGAGRTRNRAIGVIRAAIERTFALLKRWCDRSLVRNALQQQLLCLALNLRRARVLTG